MRETNRAQLSRQVHTSAKASIFLGILLPTKAFLSAIVLFAVLDGQWQLFPSAEGTRTTRFLLASSVLRPWLPWSIVHLGPCAEF